MYLVTLSEVYSFSLTQPRQKYITLKMEEIQQQGVKTRLPEVVTQQGEAAEEVAGEGERKGGK